MIFIIYTSQDCHFHGISIQGVAIEFVKFFHVFLSFFFLSPQTLAGAGFPHSLRHVSTRLSEAQGDVMVGGAQFPVWTGGIR